MTYQEFRDKYNGQWLDWDGCYGCQCWDLAQVYFTECLGLPSSVLSGCGLVSNMLYPPKRYALDEYFDEVPTNSMNPGDVCIWEYGHIAIFDHWDGYNCWYFSQNPNPSQVMKITDGGMHSFRLKTKKEITPNVEKDEYKNQIEVKVSELRVRSTPSLNGIILGYANKGFYNFYETKDNDGYTWYKIANDQWIASSKDWTNIYLAKSKDEFINIPPSIEERNIYDINTKKQINVIKPKKFGGLSYKILSYQEGKTYAEIETHDYGKVLVKITDMTPITNTPQYSHGNY